MLPLMTDEALYIIGVSGVTVTAAAQAEELGAG
jgi:hypothetical protein